LQEAIARFRQEGALLRLKTTLSVICFVGAFIALLALLKYPSGAIGITCCLALCLFGAICIPHTSGKALQTLQDLDDSSCFGVLIEALPDALGADRATIKALLLRFAPRLEECDYTLLTHRQRRALYERLTLIDRFDDGELQIAILEALGRIGDAAVLPIVERLSQGVAISPREKLLRAAAKERLALLQERCERKRETRDLLRPADSAAPDAHLLRPLSSTSEALESLLRPIQVNHSASGDEKLP
jgi:hypothetical protein